MKWILFITMLLSSLKNFCQFPIISKDSLSKYSYTIGGIQKSYKNDASFDMGTCFFIKKKENLFLITAKHVLYKCDSITNKEYTPFISAIVYLPNSRDLLQFPVPPVSDTCINIIKDTDLLVIRMDKKWLNHVNSVENFLVPPLKDIGDLEIFGQGMERDSASLFFVKPHHIDIPKNTFIAYTTTPTGDSKYIDSVHYFFEMKKIAISNWLKGFSGSPVFLQDSLNNHWRLCGALNGAFPQISEELKGGFVIVKPEYILKRIDSLLNQQ